MVVHPSSVICTIDFAIVHDPFFSTSLNRGPWWYWTYFSTILSLMNQPGALLVPRTPTHIFYWSDWSLEPLEQATGTTATAWATIEDDRQPATGATGDDRQPVPGATGSNNSQWRPAIDRRRCSCQYSTTRRYTLERHQPLERLLEKPPVPKSGKWLLNRQTFLGLPAIFYQLLSSR